MSVFGSTSAEPTIFFRHCWAGLLGAFGAEFAELRGFDMKRV
jgi:hypothetical protein